MKNTFLIKEVLLSFITLLFVSCAIEKSPSGGPKNTTPPEVLSINPPINSVNVKTKQVIIAFNEFISLKNINQELVINPYIDNKEVETFIRGKKLIFTLPKNLEPNTTYNFNFGNSITDLQEYTPLTNFTYMFSTGPIIDSLSAVGKLSINTTTRKPSNTTIGLYNTSDTINPSIHRPIYYSKTVNDEFYINNLPNKKYQVFAFTDDNNNLLYDSLTENIAFVNKLYDANINDSLKLNLFKREGIKLKFNRPVYNDNFVEINFNIGLLDINTNNDYIISENGKVLKIYPKTDVSNVKFIATDSNKFSIDTTVIVTKSKTILKDSLLILKQNSNYNPYLPFKGIEITANHLIKSVNTDSIKIVLNQDTIKFSDTIIEYKLDKSKNIIQFYTPKKDQNISLIFGKQAITAISGHYSKNATYSYLIKDKRAYGQITGKINSKVEHYILYLVDQNNKVIDKLIDPKQLDYQYVMPGNYSIKVLIDANNNGLYDTGNIKTKTQPEQYFFYDKPIVVKANWEVGNLILNVE